jgi:hypothetical protein
MFFGGFILAPHSFNENAATLADSGEPGPGHHAGCATSHEERLRTVLLT